MIRHKCTMSVPQKQGGRAMVRLIAVLVLFWFQASFASAANSPSQQNSSRATASAPKSFDSPQEAAKALIQAADPYDVPALMAILGPEAQDLVSSADPVQDKNAAANFAAKAREKNEV